MAWKNRVGKGAALLTGVVYGAGLMYLLDPEVGRRRRHEIRQELVRARNQARGWLRGEVQHQMHRARGVVAEWRARLRETDIPPTKSLKGACGRNWDTLSPKPPSSTSVAITVG